MFKLKKLIFLSFIGLMIVGSLFSAGAEDFDGSHDDLTVRFQGQERVLLKKVKKNFEKQKEKEAKAVRHDLHEFDHHLDVSALMENLKFLNTKTKRSPIIILNILKILYASFWLSFSYELEQFIPKSLKLIFYSIEKAAKEAALESDELEEEIVFSELINLDHQNTKAMNYIESISLWELHVLNDRIKEDLNFIRKKIDSTSNSVFRDLYEKMHLAYVSFLHQTIDKKFGENIFKIKTIASQGKVLDVLENHAKIAYFNSQEETRKQLLETKPWIEELYDTLYNWLKNNNQKLLLLPKDGPVDFEFPPHIMELPIVVVPPDALSKKEEKISKKTKQERQREKAELEAELNLLFGEDLKQDKRKTKQKKVKVSSTSFLSTAEKPTIAAHSLQKPAAAAAAALSPVVTVKVGRPPSPFADHIELPMLYRERVEDWFKNVPQGVPLDRHNALLNQGYHVPGNFRNNLLREYGPEVIIANHRFPKVIDAHLLHSPFVKIIQQEDGKSYQVTLPGYREIRGEDGIKQKEFGIFEVAYYIEEGKRKIYHRFFRPVDNSSKLVADFELSKQERKMLFNTDQEASGLSSKGWTISNEADGWKYDEITPVLSKITKPGSNVSYGVLNLQ